MLVCTRDELCCEFIFSFIVMYNDLWSENKPMWHLADCGVCGLKMAQDIGMV